MIEDIKKDAAARMHKCLDQFKQALAKLRTGRASTALLEHVKVEYYGNETPLNQVASVVVEDARTLTVTPWEKSLVSAIEKAILASDLGLTPNTAGTVIRINLPPLTEERRRELIKLVKAETEAARVAIRNVRRDANQAIKELAKDRRITSDVEKKAEAEIQKLTDQYIAKVEEAMAAKEKELLVV
jgi:ribosome recycling factor